MPDADTLNTPSVPARSRLPDFADQFLQPFSHLRSDVDRLFDNFGLRLPSLTLARAGAAAPALEMTETDNAYKLTAELPGLKSDDIEVSCEDGMLRLAGEKKDEREENERGYRLSERAYGSFERLVRLPSGADGEKITADFRNGVLTITVPKADGAAGRSRKIPIATA